MSFRPDHIVVHHSATSPLASVADIRNAHLERGFDDIGYHYLIDPEGGVIAGRPEHMEGAHALGINKRSIGVCCIGNFEEHNPPAPQIAALAGLLKELTERFSIAPNRVITHREVKTFVETATATLCPGRFLQEVVDDLRATLGAAVPEQEPEREEGPPLLTLVPEQGELIRLEGRIPLPDKHARAGAMLPRPADTLFLCLRREDSDEPAWSAYTGGIGSEHHLAFSARFPSWVVPPGTGVRLSVRKAAANIEAAPALIDVPLQLPIQAEIRCRRPAYGTRIEITDTRTLQGFILQVSGMVRNTGTVTWVNDDDDRPMRLGVLVLSEQSPGENLFELRHDFLSAPLTSGSAAPFRFTVSLLQFPPGRYTLYLNMVWERRFWFSAFFSPGTSVDFEALAIDRMTLATESRLLNPPASLAPTAADATLLYIAPTLPLFDRSGGGWRLLELFRMLVRSGVRITFLYEQPGCSSSPQKYFDALHELGVEVAGDPLGYLSNRAGERYSLCVIGWFECAERYLPGVRRLLPDTRIAVDSVDLHWLREERARSAGDSATSAEESAALKHRERSAYAGADEVWVVSAEEQAALAKELPGMKTRIIGMPSNRHPIYDERSPEIRLLFIGGFNHPPNEGAALWAAEITREYVRASGRSVRLDIVGSRPPPSVAGLHDGQTVFVHGFVPNTDEFFRRSTALLAPLRFGAGVKGKVCEAIAKGLPVVTTPIGCEGLSLRPGHSVLTAQTTAEFVRALTALFDGAIDVDLMRGLALDALLADHGTAAITPVLKASCIAPRVVIAIVSYNARALLGRCLDALFHSTRYPAFRVAVVSNGCTDGTREWLRNLAAENRLVDAYLNETNGFFVRPNNEIIARYADSDVVLMNNDVEVLHEGWLTNLVDAAYSAPAVACAGGRILGPDGVISEAGAEAYSTGRGRNLGRGLPDDHPSVLVFRSVGFVSGCLMYMRRDAIDTIGPLDDDFHPMYFEDVAWNYRAHMHGLRTIYTPWCKAVHREGSSAGTTPGDNMKRFQEINREKFVAKFQDVEQYNG